MELLSFDNDVFSEKVSEVINEWFNREDWGVDDEDAPRLTEHLLLTMGWRELEGLRNEIATNIQQQMAAIGRVGYPRQKAQFLADGAMRVFLKHVGNDVMF